jgi:23S rRNA pseudouridine1911/1915/1917 synthase
MNFIENASRNKIQEAAKNGHIFVDGKAVKQNHKVKANQEVKILLEYPREDFELVPEDIPLEIVYEDDELLVVNKPAGMVVHPGHGNRSGTLVNALVYHFKNLPENSSRRPGLVHRIDKETSGLLVVAKTDEAMTKLADQFFHKTSKREYIAMVWGNMKDDKGKIQGHIGRNPKNRLQNLVFEGADADEFGKAAVTHYQVLERLGYITLISCRLETGRTHQIRVHLKHIGHTLFNDKRYGGDHILKGTVFTKYKQFVENAFKILPRQALHAKTLGFEHPKTGKWMQFDSEVPEDMQNTLEKWRKYAENRSLYE